MKIQYVASASATYWASTGLSSVHAATDSARSGAPRAAARRVAVRSACDGSSVLTAISWTRPGSRTTSVWRSATGMTMVPASNSSRPVRKMPVTVYRSLPIEPSAAEATTTSSSPTPTSSCRAISSPTTASYRPVTGRRPAASGSRKRLSATSRSGSTPSRTPASVASPELASPLAYTRGAAATTEGSASMVRRISPTSAPSRPPMVSYRLRSGR